MIDDTAAERMTAAFNAHDLDGLAELLADDVVCRAPGAAEERGRAACLELHRRWLADFPDAHLDVRARYGVGEVIVEEGIFRGTHRGVAATGRSVALSYVRVLRVRGGRHVSMHLMFDRLLLLEQLGLA